MSLSRILELHHLAMEECRKYPRKRFIYRELMHEEGRHFTGIVGPRGVGKTILLRQYALENQDAFYLSADTFDPEDDPWDLIGKLHRLHGVRSLLLDEIHFLSDAPGILKRLYDFLDLRVLFTSSAALSMHASAHDLSRRVRLIHLRPFSFREYLTFTRDTELPALALGEIAQGRWTPAHIRWGYAFEEYLRGGLFPFALQELEPVLFLGNILDTVIVKDIPSVARLAVDELERIKSLLRFIGRSGVDGINYSTLSRNLGITKYKAEQYVSLLEKTFILHRIFPVGTNVLREPKVLMTPPCRLLFRDYDDAVGGLREDYFAEAMTQAGIRFHYLKSTRGAKTPDYLIESDPERLVVEIGGRGKGRQQFKGIRIDRKLVFAHILTPEENRLPLFLLGFLV